jgi:YHS domain-containing protein
MHRPSKLAVFLLSLFFVFSARAGEFFEPGGVAIRGYDPVAYFKEGKPAPGSEKFTAQYKGSLFRFASAANRDVFAASPERYAPQYGGFCAYAAALGHKAPVDPGAFTIHNHKLYLNFNKPTEDLWRKDINGFIGKADKLWPEVMRKPHP